MTVTLDSRKRRILQAIVQEYIQTAEPVGSEILVRRAGLQVSPATVRNEMAALEEMGLLQQPHTSAGRVPTDLAYRVYVDSMLSEEALSAEERHRLRRQVHSIAEEADRLIRRAARALAHEMHYPSVVATVRTTDQVFRHLHLIPLEGRRVLAVLVTDLGVYEGQPVGLPEAVGPDQLEQLSRWISGRLEGLTLAEISRGRLEAIVGEVTHYQRLLNHLRRWLEREFRRATAARILVEGTTHLLEQPEFRQIDTASAILSALEREEVLQEILRPMEGQAVWVAIGNEMPYVGMRACSIVAATYHAGGRTMGTLAMLGPTRMPYDRAVPRVRYLARHLSEALTNQSP